MEMLFFVLGNVTIFIGENKMRGLMIKMITKEKIIKLKDFYTDELSMWELAKDKALKLGRLPVLYDFNIDRLIRKLIHIRRLLDNYEEGDE